MFEIILNFVTNIIKKHFKDFQDLFKQWVLFNNQKIHQDFLKNHKIIAKD